jgi:ABC-type nitrate/sulfonate/bicarbonate transport system substrate-binding protein
MPWEGVAAARAGHSLNVFRMADAGIPYCYSPVLAATRETLDRDGDAVRALLAATARGYQTAAADPAAGAAALLSAAAAMQPALSPPLDAGVVSDSMVQLSGLLLDKQGRWGCMAETCWDAFLDWLSAQGLLTTRAPSRAARPGDGGPLATLDELRAGGSGGGDPVPRDTVVAAVLMTNAYLPP